MPEPTRDADDQSLDDWFKEYDRLSDALEPYYSKIFSKLYDPAARQPLTEPERLFFDLWYYWSAALDNNGDVFGYVPFILAHKADFVSVGAVGTLDALDKLMPYYREQQKLKDDEKGAYWWRTLDDRAAVEGLAEGVREFARLLLAYAQKNLTTTSEEQRPGRTAHSTWPGLHSWGARHGLLREKGKMKE